ncbi:hypothetical protein GIB67_010908 [Kingdonia uniflora]|uniref:1-phosphatidylinositol-3-phosphate 5-kinase n=1 Tax=Kingdonia uniflora TaxID=39325 RepID=A0A7J7M4Y7_9MAGN|nr:hypothetical protein GIB67_010908 [Kingdonia uniflora]
MGAQILSLIETVRSWFGFTSIREHRMTTDNRLKEDLIKCDREDGSIGLEVDCEKRVDHSSQIRSESTLQTLHREMLNNDSCKLFQSHHLARFLEAQRHSSSPTHSVVSSGAASSTENLSPLSFNHSSSRSDEEDVEDSETFFFSPFSEYCLDISDIHPSSINARDDFYSYKSVGSSPFDSPSRIANFLTDSISNQETTPVLSSPERVSNDVETDDCSNNLLILADQSEKFRQPLDFENNGPIWCPPPPDDPEDDLESSYFEYDDDDDDDGGDSGMLSSSSSFSTNTFSVKSKSNESQKVHGHFRALVSQLLQGEGIYALSENCGEGWLDVVTSVAWRAANFVKPDTSRGGTMDPGDYVKVKCISSGSPSQSTLIKGVVCTKNIKHKRMPSQFKNPRLLLLGGSLEYERAPNQLESLDTLLQQEIDYLKMVILKIEAHHPNVLLVEKSVSSYAQEYLLAKEISLVLNVKRPLLERIARCTGALIVPSTNKILSARLGHCEIFRLERMVEDCVVSHESNKKSARTLMFFEGCPRRLGCTILLKGACREVLKKVKHVVQYAVFAAYHLSLETSFLVDEGATLPKVPVKASVDIPQRPGKTEGHISGISSSAIPTVCADVLLQRDGSPIITSELLEVECLYRDSNGGSCPQLQTEDQHELLESSVQEEGRTLETQMQIAEGNHQLPVIDSADESDALSEYLATVDNHPSILVSFSNRSLLKGKICGSHLLRIRFYGNFDKPLGRYLRDDLFDKTLCCQSCKESSDSHVRCYIHQHGSLTINVRRLPSVELSGERDGKIWMWHRCLKCAHVDGVPPATRRVLMSDAACGLSFGKFLELSFSNHATANRVASCGHLLQRDCLRYYGCGDMVSFFRYAPIDILSVCLPPSRMEFKNQVPQKWMKKESIELSNKMKLLYADISNIFHNIEQKGLSSGFKILDGSDIHNHITNLKDLLENEKIEYQNLLSLEGDEDSEATHSEFDILELNRLRRCLLIDCYIWDRRLYSLETLLDTNRSDSYILEATTYCKLTQLRNESLGKDIKLGHTPEELSLNPLTVMGYSGYNLHLEQKEEPNTPLHSVSIDLVEQNCSDPELTSGRLDSYNLNIDREVPVDGISLGHAPIPACLSDKIDSAWTGTAGNISQMENPSYRRLKSPMRVHSFDSAMRIKERTSKGLSPSTLRISSLKSFHASSDYGSMAKDPIPNLLRAFSQTSPRETQKLNLIFSSLPSILPSASHMAGDGVRLLLPLTGHSNMVIPVYDNEPTSVISYALSSKEYENRIAYNLGEHEGRWNDNKDESVNLSTSVFPSFQCLVSLDSDDTLYRSRGSDDSLTPIGTRFSSPKKSPHFTISFEDDTSLFTGKVRFSSTIYFARQFDALRKKCCPSEVDFIRSLSRCSRWHAQGGKSNVFFARSLDERLIIKQVTKTELDSFMDFAPEYFKYLTDSISTGSPTCLAKILGIYNVTVKHFKSGRETKMDLMVMENLFFGRNISKVYDLKGSARSRYISDAAGKNRVLLDTNLLETLSTNPIFLGRKAKRSLERAVWNDTSFLAAIDVMDYSLLVGVDNESKELVIGIIDFMRQYTWDKHLETWAKSSGILGGPRNASPTVISPMQYKKRFRKAMSAYFLTVADN